MGNYAIRMLFEIGSDQAHVRNALTTRDGIAAWWSDTVAGEPSDSGGDLLVTFPDLPQPFHFRVDLDDDGVRWATLEFPPWWEGTTIRWSLQPAQEGDGTQLLFTHDGFDPNNEVIPLITPAWAAIIGRLKQYAETGEADPFARN